MSTNKIGRTPAFGDPEMAAIVAESIRFQCRKADADLLAYCVMPDHVHVCIAIGGGDLIRILHDFKSYTGPYLEESERATDTYGKSRSMTTACGNRRHWTNL